MTPYWNEEYKTTKGDVDLFLYRRCKSKPIGDVKPPILFLVHGSSFSALPNYDLKVPGKPDYSVMNVCADLGYDVWTMDHEGYGKSSRTKSFSGISDGADDLYAASKIIERETGISRCAYYGQSSGSLRAGLFAERYPERVERLVLDAFVWTGEGSRTLAKRSESLQSFLSHNMRKVTRESLRGALLRDDPDGKMVESDIPDFLADTALSDADSVPSGTFVDMCSKLPIVDPTKIICPVLILRGDHDGMSSFADIQSFFSKLPNPDKHFSMMANSGHIAPLGVNRKRFYSMLHCFLDLDPII